MSHFCLNEHCYSPVACGGFGYCREINIRGGLSEPVRIGNATLYLGDCRTVLPSLAIGDDALIVSDPPYANGALNGGKIARSRRGYDPNVRGHIWPDVIGNDAPFNPGGLLLFPNLILWGANNYASRLPDSPCWLAWDRKMTDAAKSNIGDAELAYVRGLPYKTIRMFRHMWAGFQRDSEVGEKHVHPTQKPIALMEWCIQFFPNATTIIDPYMGSGPSGVAAVKLGRRFIGIEIEPRYFDIACRRIEEATRQPDLFIERPTPAEQLTLE